MFRWLHTLYNCVIDKPSVVFYLNIWSYVNVRYYKFKFIKYIYIWISTLDFLKLKYINVLYKDISFDFIFNKLINYIFILSILFYFI